MANMKTGLSYFNTGGTTETTEEPTKTEGALVKAVPPKGKYAVSSPIGALPVSANTLQNMQRLLAEKEAQQGSFLERLKDAKAVFSGYGQEQTQGMDLRTKQREEQAANIFQMRNQIEQQKAAQAQLANLKAEDAKSGWGMPQAGSTAAPGAVPAQGAIPSDIVAQYNDILTHQGRDKALEFRSKYLQEVNKARLNPNQDPIVTFPIGNENVEMPLSFAQKLAARDPKLQAYLNRLYPENAVPVVNAPATNAPATNAPATNAPATNAPATNAPATNAPAAPVMPNANAPVIKTPNAQINPNAGGVGVGGGSGFGSKERNQANLELQKKLGEAIISGRQKEWEKLSEKAAENVAYLEKAGNSSTDDIARYNKIDKLTTNSPYAFGVLQKPGFLTGALKAIEEGANVGNYNVNIPGVETFVRQAGGTEDDITAANMAAREFAGLQLNAIKLLQGTGSVSDAEQRLLQRFSGSTALDVRTIKDLIKWGKARSEYDRDMNEAWKKWQIANRATGTTFRDFYLYSDERAKLSEGWKKKTESMLEDYDKIGNKPSGGAKAELERRRAEKKKLGESK